MSLFGIPILWILVGTGVFYSVIAPALMSSLASTLAANIDSLDDLLSGFLNGVNGG